MLGDVLSEIKGDVLDKVLGDVLGEVLGDVLGEVLGDELGNVLGEVLGEVLFSSTIIVKTKHFLRISFESPNCTVPVGQATY